MAFKYFVEERARLTIVKEFGGVAKWTFGTTVPYRTIMVSTEGCQILGNDSLSASIIALENFPTTNVIGTFDFLFLFPPTWRRCPTSA